jgi:hypothetical protein
VLPDYWIERPPFRTDRATEAVADAFFERLDANAGTGLLDVDQLLGKERVVRWQFLSILAARRRIAFHGTGDPGIERFEPREPVDFAPFGQQRALPAETFVEQPGGEYAGQPAHIPQLASPAAVTPFARLRVSPRSFPFLGRIRGHDDERLGEYAQAVMAAAPWPE